ncbi:MAG: transglycosylase SLT domain-containing protein [Lentisphaerae bacterium]|nr:transglycosylase SLT domain-containing protein [Lentisphaerota bacterium]
MEPGFTRRIIKALIAALLIGLALAIGTGIVAYRYIHAYDADIAGAAQEYGVDERLIRAVIWRESHFTRRRVGSRGEIGLMQVTENAAREWAAAAREPVPGKRELFKPSINIRAGTWYLQRALQFWSQKRDPLPYALCEYNAGRTPTLRWAAQDQNDPEIFLNAITYPTTRRYVRDILKRYRRSQR